MKTVKNVLIAAIVLLPLIWGLAVEPNSVIQQNHLGWLYVRLIVLASSVVLAAITYGGYKVGEYLKDMTFLKWAAWWVIAFQVMTSWYVAEWCISGL